MLSLHNISLKCYVKNTSKRNTRACLEGICRWDDLSSPVGLLCSSARHNTPVAMETSVVLRSHCELDHSVAPGIFGLEWTLVDMRDSGGHGGHTHTPNFPNVVREE